MCAMIRNELRQTRKALCIWTGVMLLLCAFSYFEWLSFRDSMEELTELLNRFPRLVLIMFGVRGIWNGQMDLFCCIYFWLALVGFAYAVCLGVTCMGKEYKSGTFEYLFTKPVSRAQIVLAKSVAAGINLLVFAVFSGIGCYLFGVSQLHLFSGASIMLIAVGMFLTQLLLFAAALFTAAWAGYDRAAARRGAVLLLLFYAVYFAVEYTENFTLRYLTPLEYFNVYDVAGKGISFVPFLLTVTFVFLCVRVSMTRWARREM